MKLLALRIFASLTLACSAACALAQITLPVGEYSMQWSSLAATDKTWFYLDSNGKPQTTGNGVYPTPQLKVGRTNNTVNAVLTRGTNTVTVTYTYYNSSGQTTYTCPWQVQGATWTRTSSNPAGSPVTLTTDPPVNTPESFTIAPASWASFSVTLTGNFPNVVCYGDIGLSVIVGLPGDGGGLAVKAGSPIKGKRMGTGGGQTIHVYFVDQSPTGNMATPWCDILNYSCLWCDGKTGASAIDQYCTTGLANAGLFQYNGTATNWIDTTTTDANVGKFNLEGFFARSKVATADCRDVSSFLQLCVQTQGESSALDQFWTGQTDSTGQGTMFTTNSLEPIGNSSYITTSWHYHQVLVCGGVYDACAKQFDDLSGNPFKSNPVNWPTGGYWQTNVGGTFYGLVDYLTGPPTAPAPTSPTITAALLKGPADTSKITLLKGVY